MLNVRRKRRVKGPRSPYCSRIVLLYDENLHGPGKPLEDVFEAGICARPDDVPGLAFRSTGEGYVPSMYKKYGAIVARWAAVRSCLRGSRRGGMKPADENDKPVFVGRWNIGA